MIHRKKRKYELGRLPKKGGAGRGVGRLEGTDTPSQGVVTGPSVHLVR